VSELGDEEQEQELIARQLAEELSKLRVQDVVISSLVQVSSIAYRRLGLTAETAEQRDLEQVRLAIDTLNALVPVVERVVPPELVGQFRDEIANLQLAYVKAASGESPGGGEAA
jgi:hypothetical protein